MTDYPIYIAIPHRGDPQQWFATDEELEDGDRHIAGDRDLHILEKFECAEDIAVYMRRDNRGHGVLATKCLLETLQEEADD